MSLVISPQLLYQIEWTWSRFDDIEPLVVAVSNSFIKLHWSKLIQMRTYASSVSNQ